MIPHQMLNNVIHRTILLANQSDLLVRRELERRELERRELEREEREERKLERREKKGKKGN